MSIVSSAWKYFVKISPLLVKFSCVQLRTPDGSLGRRSTGIMSVFDTLGRGGKGTTKYNAFCLYFIGIIENRVIIY